MSGENEKEVNKEKEAEEALVKQYDEYEWMIRPCSTYKEEYKECIGFRARFHQYFIFGKVTDCHPWKRDHDNCLKWIEKNDAKAKIALIKSEMSRKTERLKGHYDNDIWKTRQSPPEDWNKPLPDWLAKKYENTYLAIKSRELKSGKIEFVDISQWRCTIL